MVTEKQIRKVFKVVKAFMMISEGVIIAFFTIGVMGFTQNPLAYVPLLLMGLVLVLIQTNTISNLRYEDIEKSIKRKR